MLSSQTSLPCDVQAATHPVVSIASTESSRHTGDPFDTTQLIAVDKISAA